jgi:hypothetical protein
MKVSEVVERRRRRGAGRRRRSFSVPRSGDEAQEAGKRRKKKMVWGKKEKFTPRRPIYISPGKGRGDRGKCSTAPTVSAGNRHVAARSGAAVPITVPLGNDGTQ